MRLVILGGGGFRVPLVYEAAAARAGGVAVDEIVLHDSDPGRLAAIGAVVGELADGYGRSAPAYRTTTDLADALRGADFVFSAIRVGGAHARTVDERVALDLGLLGQETIGPGGLAYALRTIGPARRIAEAVAEIAPRAWVINFTNPAGIVTEVMRGVLGERAVGICDTPIGLVRRLARVLDLDLDADAGRIGYDYLGLNHLGWLRSFTVDGTDRLPGVLADDHALERIEEARLFGFDWVRALGSIPNEYLFYYFFTDEARRRIEQAGETRGEFLVRQQDAFYAGAGSDRLADWRRVLREREESYMAETRDEEREAADIAGGGYQEVAMRLMAALAGGPEQRMILDVGNRAGDQRLVAALPDDLVVEVPCVVDSAGVHPQPVAAPDLAQLGMMARLRGSERLIAEAALTGSRERAWEGFALHPLVDSPVLGRRLLDGYLTAEPLLAEVLPAGSSAR